MRIAILLGTLLLASCQTFTSTLSLQNETNRDLVPYPVVTTPPPPHRAPDTANTIAPSGRLEIDPEGFNPVFYFGGVGDLGAPNGVFVGLGFYDQEPPIIHIRLFHYVVPPGQEGSDPALQPVLLREDFEEVQDENLVIRVIRGMPGGGDLPLVVRIEPDPGA